MPQMMLFKHIVYLVAVYCHQSLIDVVHVAHTVPVVCIAQTVSVVTFVTGLSLSLLRCNIKIYLIAFNVTFRMFLHLLLHIHDIRFYCFGLHIGGFC